MIARTPVQVADRTLSLSNLDKPLYPNGFTKGEVIEYYTKIAPFIMPHLRNRPVSLKRFPGGVNDDSFFQKNCPSHRPDWVETMSVKSESGRRGKNARIDFCVVSDEATLIWLANLAALELHTYLSTTKDFNTPTMMVFDLDPGPGMDLLDCLRVGVDLHDALLHFDLRSFPKTSGGKGLHLAVPLNTKVSFDETKSFSRAIAGVLERDDPKRITTNMSKREREGRVFIDWSQNDRHKTTVCVYSLRARQTPTVSWPLRWKEVKAALNRGSADALITEAAGALRKIKRRGDAFSEVLTLKQRLPKQAEVASSTRD